jgi:DNA-binding transcriptional MerR regulator
MRQLDYWDRAGIMKPSLAASEGKGYGRVYSAQDVLELMVAKRLLESGMSPGLVRRCLDFLRYNRAAYDPTRTSLIVKDGRSFALRRFEEISAEDFGQGETVLVVHLRPLAEKVKTALEAQGL